MRVCERAPEKFPGFATLFPGSQWLTEVARAGAQRPKTGSRSHEQVSLIAWLRWRADEESAESHERTTAAVA